MGDNKIIIEQPQTTVMAHYEVEPLIYPEEYNEAVKDLKMNFIKIPKKNNYE